MSSKSVIKRIACQLDCPHIAQLGVPILKNEAGMYYVPWAELNSALEARGIAERFGNLLGTVTATDHGLYPRDVEDVLVRINTGSYVGTQTLAGWD